MFVAAVVVAGLLLNLTAVQRPFGILLVGSLTAAGVELLPPFLNDNLTIPVVSSGIMELLARMIGCV